MTDKETAEHLRQWVADGGTSRVGPFGWPTDGCGYEQHMRFVKHRNAQTALIGDYNKFVLEYADKLDP